MQAALSIDLFVVVRQRRIRRYILAPVCAFGFAQSLP
jgi:hypothetical protein